MGEGGTLGKDALLQKGGGGREENFLGKLGGGGGRRKILLEKEKKVKGEVFTLPHEHSILRGNFCQKTKKKI